jgi:hypothetical protein
MLLAKVVAPIDEGAVDESEIFSGIQTSAYDIC